MPAISSSSPRRSATACSKARPASRWWRSAAPALHETFADHELRLPNGVSIRRATSAGQHFLRHIAVEHALDAVQRRRSAGDAALGRDWRARRSAHRSPGRIVDASTSRRIAGELVFGFVLDGSAASTSRGFTNWPGGRLRDPAG